MTEHIIYVHDPKAMKAYYTDKLGFTLLAEREGPRYVLGFENTPIRIVLASHHLATDPKQANEMPSLLLKVKDIHKVYNTMRDRGVVVSDLFELGDMKTFNFADGENHYMACWQR